MAFHREGQNSMPPHSTFSLLWTKWNYNELMSQYIRPPVCNTISPTIHIHIHLSNRRCIDMIMTASLTISQKKSLFYFCIFNKQIQRRNLNIFHLYITRWNCCALSVTRQWGTPIYMHYASARKQIGLMGELLRNARYASGLLRRTSGASNNTDTDTKICIMGSKSLPFHPSPHSLHSLQVRAITSRWMR
jgi:hypothetical protein